MFLFSEASQENSAGVFNGLGDIEHGNIVSIDVLPFSKQEFLSTCHCKLMFDQTPSMSLQDYLLR